MLKQKSRGVTLVEVMMVLGVLAILLGLIMTIMGTVQSKKQANRMVEELLTIKQQVVEICDSSEATCPSNTDISVILANSKLLPNSYVGNDGNRLADVYGNPLVIVYVSAKEAQSMGYATEALIEFGILLDNKAECMTIFAAMAQGPVGNYFRKMGDDLTKGEEVVKTCNRLSFPSELGGLL